MSPKRARDLWPDALKAASRFPVGRSNSIEDVRGVGVTHVTINSPGRGYCTGATVIWPHPTVFDFRPRAQGYFLHGAGEITGLAQVMEWGLIETPIVLTSSLSIGTAYEAVIDHAIKRRWGIGSRQDVILPVVGECDDSMLNRSWERPLTRAHVLKALEQAERRSRTKKPGVLEGSVGAGTGMVSFDYKAGIGTASRIVHGYRLGVLLNANFGFRRHLRAAGHPVGRKLEAGSVRARKTERSVIAVLATDAPIRSEELKALCVRVGMGFARAGSFAGRGSGEGVIGFSTALGVPRGRASRSAREIPESQLNAFYEAAVECTEEAVLNSLVAPAQQGTEFLGRDGVSSCEPPWFCLF